jgi:hypothetical protein
LKNDQNTVKITLKNDQKFTNIKENQIKRSIDYHLSIWQQRRNRKPLILRGARQVGKTHAIRALGSQFDAFVEINFELDQAAKSLFDIDLSCLLYDGVCANQNNMPLQY